MTPRQAEMYEFYSEVLAPYIAALKRENDIQQQLINAGYSQANISDLFGHSRSEYLAREKALVLWADVKT